MSSQVVRIDSLRSLGFGGISSSYAPIGGPFMHLMRIIKITNSTNADLTLSVDQINDNLFLPAGSFTLFDLTTNKVSNTTTFCFQNGTQFYVKGTPSSGSIYLEALYGQGD